jgi:hypothetical protein
MLLRAAALALLVAFSAPIAASAMTASPAPTKMKMKKKKATGVTNKVPGGPGFTGSSPLGSAEKKKKKDKM